MFVLAGTYMSKFSDRPRSGIRMIVKTHTIRWLANLHFQ